MIRLRALTVIVLSCCLMGEAAGLGRTAKAQDDPTWRRAVELKDRMLIVDAHSHDLFKPESKQWPKQVNLSFLAKGGVDGLVQGLPLAPGKVEDPVGMILANIRNFYNPSKMVLQMLCTAPVFWGEHAVPFCIGIWWQTRS